MAKEREQSSIAFPYIDLDSAIAVAAIILGAGGVALTREQLAGLMKSSTTSGTFFMKVSAAKMFGLISTNQGKIELTNLGFSILDKDEKRQRQARADAFLAVPLFARAYEEFRGKQLPPRPQGLEQAFVKFGVAIKQKGTARLAFDKSAAQAGFFPNGPDRLIEPIIGTVSPIERSRSSTEVTDGDDEGWRERPEQNASGMHPFIRGLIDALPAPGTNWAVEGRAKWLQAAANNFDLMYMGSGQITITAKAEPQSAKAKESD